MPEPTCVILESPYAGTSRNPIVRWFQRQANVRYARRCLRDSLMRGEAPIASHLLYTQPGVLRDDDPQQRQQGIDAGLAWRKVADKSVVYIDRGITAGMRYGVQVAHADKRRVEFRSIDGASPETVSAVKCDARRAAGLSRL